MNTPFTDGAKYEDISKVSEYLLLQYSKHQLTKSPQLVVFVAQNIILQDNREGLLKRNKYICILSIAVTTLLYIMTKYDYHIWYVHRACPYSSGRNSYQALCIKSGEFWRALGSPHVRRH